MKGDAADLWLQANDPNYVSPADKAAVTRSTEWDLEALDEIVADSTHTIRQGSTWGQGSFVGFTGDAEQGTCQVEVVDWTTPDDILEARETQNSHRRGVSKSKARKARNRKNRAKKRWHKIQARKNVA